MEETGVAGGNHRPTASNWEVTGREAARSDLDREGGREAGREEVL